MNDDELTGSHDVAPVAWVVLDTRDLLGSVAVFWRETEALDHAATLSARGGKARSQRVSIRGNRWRCHLCGEPVELDDPDDELSWGHTPDANDLADHTAEI